MDTICVGRLPSTWNTAFRLTSRPLRVLHVYEVGRGIYRFTLPFFLYCPDGDGAPWIITMKIYDLFFLKWRVQNLHIPSLPGSQTACVRDLCLVWLAFKSHCYNNFLKAFFFSFCCFQHRQRNACFKKKQNNIIWDVSSRHKADTDVCLHVRHRTQCTKEKRSLFSWEQSAHRFQSVSWEYASLVSKNCVLISHRFDFFICFPTSNPGN